MGVTVDAVGLVEQHEICQCDVLVEFGVPLTGAAEFGRVHDEDESAVAYVLVARAHDEPDHVARLGESAGLDDDDVDVRGAVCEPVEHRVHVGDVDGAAQTAVAQRDHRVDLSRDHHRVDVDRAEVVDDHSDSRTTVVAQQVVEQGRLPGAQEACDDHHGDPLVRHEASVAVRPVRRSGDGTHRGRVSCPGGSTPRGAGTRCRSSCRRRDRCAPSSRRAARTACPGSSR